MIYARHRVLVTGPAAEPVTLAEAKAHLNVKHVYDDEFIVSLVAVSREHVEQILDRALVDSTWKAFYDEFGDLVLPLARASSVTHLKYYLEDGSAATTLATTEYQTDLNGTPAMIRLAYDKSWPDVTLRPSSGVEVQFVAGYGATAAAVPASIKHAMKLLIAHWYEHREEVIVGEVGRIASAIPLPRAVESLLVNHRAHGVII